MTGDDLNTEIEQAFPDQYKIERNPGFNDISSQPAICVQCRFCQEKLENLTSCRTHDCQGRRDANQNDLPELSPTILSRVHELGSHFMWATNGLSPYFAIVKNFDRVLSNELYFDACDDTWELDHNEEKIKYWEGQIAARDEDTRNGIGISAVHTGLLEEGEYRKAAQTVREWNESTTEHKDLQEPAEKIE